MFVIRHKSQLDVKPVFNFLASGQEKEQAKQIFTSSAASGILTNDLVKIMESEKVSLVLLLFRQI